MKVAGRKSSTAELAYPLGWMLGFFSVLFFFGCRVLLSVLPNTSLANFHAIHYPEQKFVATGLQGWSLVMAQKKINRTLYWGEEKKREKFDCFEIQNQGYGNKTISRNKIHFNWELRLPNCMGGCHSSVLLLSNIFIFLSNLWVQLDPRLVSADASQTTKPS